MWRATINGRWGDVGDDAAVIALIRAGALRTGSLVKRRDWGEPLRIEQVAEFAQILGERARRPVSTPSVSTSRPPLGHRLVNEILAELPPGPRRVLDDVVLGPHAGGRRAALLVVGACAATAILVSALVAKKSASEEVAMAASASEDVATAARAPDSPRRTAPAFVVTRESIVGAWLLRVSNPATPNTVASDYMRHVFGAGGMVEIREDELAPRSFPWTFEGGQHVVAYKMGTYAHPRAFRFRSNDEVEEIDLETGHVVEAYIREGSPLARTKTSAPLLTKEEAFVDVTSLAIGSAYAVSRKTPLMPDPSPADPMQALTEVRQIKVDATINILAARDVDRTRWYQVRTSIDGKSAVGWVSSIALMGQSLKAE